MTAIANDSYFNVFFQAILDRYFWVLAGRAQGPGLSFTCPVVLMTDDDDGDDDDDDGYDDDDDSQCRC